MPSNRPESGNVSGLPLPGDDTPARRRVGTTDLRLRRASIADLREIGWTDADLEAFLADWPAATRGDLDDLAEIAQRAYAYSATPAQQRTWMRALFETWNGNVGPVPEAVAWVQRTDPARASVWDIVGAYVETAGGDHDLAALAFRAGLDVGELAGRVGDRATLDALRSMIALRDIQRRQPSAAR